MATMIMTGRQSMRLAATVAANLTSWVQVLRTGRWWDPRHLWQEVDEEMLEAMVSNHAKLTADEFPVYVDYDHGIPYATGSGEAVVAGKVLQLKVLPGPRGRTDEREQPESQLWAEVEWTERAAGLIRNREYRHTSAYYTPDYVTHQKEEIGPTLVGFAITNEPVVHGMEEVALSRVRAARRVERQREVGLVAQSEDQQLEAAVNKRLNDPDLVQLRAQGPQGHARAVIAAASRAASDVDAHSRRMATDRREGEMSTRTVKREAEDHLLAASVEARLKDPDLVKLAAQGALGKATAFFKALGRAYDDVEVQLRQRRSR